MSKQKKGLGKLIGICGVAFGVGIFITFFLSLRVIVIIQAAFLIAIGIFYLLQR